MIEKILIIEDRVDEAIYAQAEVAKAGIKEFRAVTTLSEGLDLMPEYDAVLTDLFMPAGELSVKQYSDRFQPIYDDYKLKRFPKHDENNIVLRAIQECSRYLDISPKDYVENIMANLNTPKSVLSAARDAVEGIEDFERYEKFQSVEEGIKNGTNLPLGIVSSERAIELGKPCIIVTSTYHHSDEFEAVRSLIRVPYRDTLVDGRKDWNGGIELLLR